MGEETSISFTGRIFGKGKGVRLMLDAPPEGLTKGEGGWLGRRAITKAEREEYRDGKSSPAAGQLVLVAREPLRVGDRFSIIVKGELAQGRQKNEYPSTAFPVVVVAPKADRNDAHE